MLNKGWVARDCAKELCEVAESLLSLTCHVSQPPTCNFCFRNISAEHRYWKFCFQIQNLDYFLGSKAKDSFPSKNYECSHSTGDKFSMNVSETFFFLMLVTRAILSFSRKHFFSSPSKFSKIQMIIITTKVFL